MALRSVRAQPPSAPVRVGSWSSDEDFAVHPKGSQPKRTLICPIDITEPFLVPGHTYIFKTAKVAWQAQQAWSEAIAYQIGALVGIDVPPCFIAIDDRTGEIGVLMEYFFGYPGEHDPARLIHASDFLSRILVDKKRGRPHDIRTNLKLCNSLRLPSAEDWWGSTLTFDALIGNTDRHPENWGVLVRQDLDGVRELSFAPAFDNGTSLGYEHNENKLVQLCDPTRIRTYIGKGTHHCGWDMQDSEPAPHIRMCQRFLEAHPAAGNAMRNVIRFEMAQIAEILDGFVSFDIALPFTAERARFVLALIEARRALLANALGG